MPWMTYSMATCQEEKCSGNLHPRFGTVRDRRPATAVQQLYPCNYIGKGQAMSHTVSRSSHLLRLFAGYPSLPGAQVIRQCTVCATHHRLFVMLQLFVHPTIGAFDVFVLTLLFSLPSLNDLSKKHLFI